MNVGNQRKIIGLVPVARGCIQRDMFGGNKQPYLSHYGGVFSSWGEPLPISDWAVNQGLIQAIFRYMKTMETIRSISLSCRHFVTRSAA